MSQRYVSNELTHFVGSSRRGRPEAQYELLRDILRSGLLRKPGGEGFGYALSPVADDLGESLSAPVVCFCDIPAHDLDIHTEKYGRFGIAFKKDFLVERGATPVFYVAKTAPSMPLLLNMFEFDRPAADRGAAKPAWPIARGRARRYDLFEHWKRAQTNLIYHATSAQPQHSTYEFMQGPWWHDYLEFVTLYVFGYVKYMDVGLADDDPENFYMEREWRVLDRVEFRLDDVVRVLLPESFARVFRTDFPEYFGQITFLY